MYYLTTEPFEYKNITIYLYFKELQIFKCTFDQVSSYTNHCLLACKHGSGNNGVSYSNCYQLPCDSL
jgi:hypothetical protein